LMKCGILSAQKNKLWLIKAIDRSTGRTAAWVLGNRDTATFQRLYDKVKRLTGCTFYTDDWKVFAKILPHERHVIGKTHTIDIEHDNSNTRHPLGRFTRRTKVVSRKKFMVDLTLRIWHSITT
jgi:insertion element IS1 protein InsB